MSHVPYSTHTVNSQPTHVHTVNNQINPVSIVNRKTLPIHTVNSRPTHPTPVHNTASPHAQTVHIDTRQQSGQPCHHTPNEQSAQQLSDTLQSLLIHRHSVLTTINALLRLHLHHQGPPTPKTLNTLRNILQDCPTAKHILPLPPPPSRPTRTRPTPNYCETDDNHQIRPSPNVHFPLGHEEGVGVGPSTLNVPGIDAGSGLFGIRPKKTHYAHRANCRNIFAKAGDYICAYTGTTRIRQDCISNPSMYLFADPDDPQQRYIDSWDPTRGVLSYGGYLNETFEDDDINCTIKFKPNQPHPGVYAKRDIYLNEELFTGYGKPQ